MKQQMNTELKKEVAKRKGMERELREENERMALAMQENKQRMIQEMKDYERAMREENEQVQAQ